MNGYHTMVSFSSLECVGEGTLILPRPKLSNSTPCDEGNIPHLGWLTRWPPATWALNT